MGLVKPLSIENYVLACGVPQAFAGYRLSTSPHRQGSLKVQAWLDRGKPLGLVLWGPSGTGKTGAAVACIRHFVRSLPGDRLAWHSAASMVARGQYDREEFGILPIWYEPWRSIVLRCSAEISRLLEYSNSELLVVDDLDSGRPTAFREMMLLEFAERPYYGKRVILTMNRPPRSLRSMFGARVVDRLEDSRFFEMVEFQGQHSARSKSRQTS